MRPLLAEFIVRNMLLIGTEQWSDHEDTRLGSEPGAEDPWAQLRHSCPGKGANPRAGARVSSSDCSQTASSVQGGWPGHTP